jgi:hypothetical protein
MSADGKMAQTLQAAKTARTAQKGQSAEATASAASAAQAKHATLRYATLRIAIFLVSLGVLWGLVAATGHIVTGNGVLYLMMGSLLVSGIASFFLLNGQRDAMSAQVSARADKMVKKIDANSAMEDEDEG